MGPSKAVFRSQTRLRWCCDIPSRPIIENEPVDLDYILTLKRRYGTYTLLVLLTFIHDFLEVSCTIKRIRCENFNPNTCAPIRHEFFVNLLSHIAVSTFTFESQNSINAIANIFITFSIRFHLATHIAENCWWVNLSVSDGKHSLHICMINVIKLFGQFLAQNKCPQTHSNG